MKREEAKAEKEFIDKHLKRIKKLTQQYKLYNEMKNTLIKTIGYKLDFIAKDSKKEYPHGYGISEIIFIPKDRNIEPKDLLELANKLFSDDEFEVITCLPLGIYQEKYCSIITP